MDDLSKRRPQDATKINVHESWEVRYWTAQLGVTEQKLRAAVQSVGVSAAAVRRYLAK